MNQYKLLLKIYLSLGLILLWLTTGFAANPNAENGIFDQMHYKDVLEMTIESDFERLINDRRNEEYQSAKLSFKDRNGQTQDWDIKVKLRGKFRRMNCSDIPPLKLKFKKSELEAAGLSDFNDMKLVTQCVHDKALAQDLIKREFAAYRLYNQISPYSYRVQMLRITYIDTNSGSKRKEWAFLIEDTAQLKARLGLEACDECWNQPFDRFHTEEIRQVSIFQYLIGNPDWGIPTSKNVKLLLKDGKIIAVPYDFDFSGLVDAPYAAPNGTLGILSVKSRVYLGFEEDPQNLYNSLYSIYGNRTDLIDLIMDMKFVNRDSRIYMVEYLEDFFDNFESIKSGEKNILELVNMVSP